ncbi:hypothetical protein NC651_018201 [Populus alba x Populus x berolinensis]|nr:hypothetical protein NC651_018201 [Populus alba x Populus x berolinensis]
MKHIEVDCHFIRDAFTTQTISLSHKLLAVVNALIHRCYKYPTATIGEVPQSLKKELSDVCRACFSTDAVNKHIDFVRDYKQDFERDLDLESTTSFPATLSELTA